MSRRHGRNGRLYVTIASSGSAEPIAFLKDWTIDFKTARVDVTGLGDANLVYVAGLPDALGQMNGFYDDATKQTYTAATDGVARAFYLYPDTVNDAAQYWYGTAFFDFSAKGGVSAALEFSANWNAASAITKVG